MGDSSEVHPILILASASPWRKDILRRAGIAFRARSPTVDERLLSGESPEAYVRRLARLKAEAVRRPDEWVLGVDTVVVVEGRILGKPRDCTDAAQMLRLLSGRVHRVLTGICLLGGRKARIEVVETRVWFHRLTATEIGEYIACGEPMGKAGAYAIRGVASKFVTRIEGCFFNVVGLPISRVSRWLRSRGKIVRRSKSNHR